MKKVNKRIKKEKPKIKIIIILKEIQAMKIKKGKDT